MAIPGPVDTFVAFNSSAAAPVALYAIGLVLARARVTADPAVTCFAVVKLLAFPAVVWALVAGLAPAAPGAALVSLASAGPSGAMAFGLALLYGVRTDTITQVIVWTSLLSLATLAVLA